MLTGRGSRDRKRRKGGGKELQIERGFSFSRGKGLVWARGRVRAEWHHLGGGDSITSWEDGWGTHAATSLGELCSLKQLSVVPVVIRR